MTVDYPNPLHFIKFFDILRSDKEQIGGIRANRTKGEMLIFVLFLVFFCAIGLLIHKLSVKTKNKETYYEKICTV